MGTTLDSILSFFRPQIKRYPPRLPFPKGPSARLAIVPGQLWVHLYRCEISGRTPRTCWFYVSEGMKRYGQPELALGLQIRDQHLPSDPLLLLGDLYRRAARTSSGGENPRRTLFGRQDISGFIYAQLPGGLVSAPPGTLAIIPLLGDEFKVSQAHGMLRVLSHLGHFADHYPFPVWFDPHRSSLLDWSQFEKASLLSKVADLNYPEANVVQVDGAVEIHLDCSLRPRVAADLKDQCGPFSLKTGLNPSADACLLWSPGQDSARAISPPGSPGQRVSGCFWLVCPNSEELDRGRIFEDGFFFLLSRPSFDWLLECLTSGLDLELETDGLRLCLIWGNRR